MTKNREIIKAIVQAKNKIKKIESNAADVGFRKDSAWLVTVNDIIDRVGLAILDELDKINN